ncbi:RNA-binding protein [Grosmannia clavigera kw1407]|uniref:RNA-binding protein n=1 Tax=Grosmannia clavigera (strain kw1407 / UAMH 11150) TaxID=655863 RepID=F0XK18_GROCL|nr:RNA-binding protein [Grosmannia clavigera kw1407]EFX01910.1 RNA-binding protein [Grosmannia clavigera kw1407]
MPLPSKKDKLAPVPAGMAPRMQTQVQKWAKMKADLGHPGRSLDAAKASSFSSAAAATANSIPHQKKTGKLASTAARPQSVLRAPHRRDRYPSVAVGGGFPLDPASSTLASSTPATAATSPPICLLCLVRFDTRQQLRDHEALSTLHRRLMRDRAARRTALQRYAKVERKKAAEADGRPISTATSSTPQLPTHIKRLPRRRGDLAPVYTSYGVPLRPAVPDADAISTSLDHGCLLCRRRFHGRASLRLHERESALHRARTRDPAAVAAAVQAVQAVQEHDEQHRPLLRMRPAPDLASTRYRDRARERRLAFGQKGVPASRKRIAKTAATAVSKDTAAVTTATAAAVSSATKGAAMLGKMGWTAGQGLGAQGTGLTEAIAAAAYLPGVGLGAHGGKLGDAADVAARRTESRYADFVEQTQETARQRYLALDRAEAEAAGQVAESAEGNGNGNEAQD